MEIRLSKFKLLEYRGISFEFNFYDRIFIVSRNTYNTDIDIVFNILQLYSENSSVFEAIHEDLMMQIELETEDNTIYLTIMLNRDGIAMESMKIDDETIVLPKSNSKYQSRFTEEILECLRSIRSVRGVCNMDEIENEKEIILNEIVHSHLLVHDYSKYLRSGLRSVGYPIKTMHIQNHNFIVEMEDGTWMNFVEFNIEYLTTVRLINRLIARRESDIGELYPIVISGVSHVSPKTFIKYQRMLQAYNAPYIMFVEEPLAEFIPNDESIFI